jgi:hypothetical protein
MPRKLKTYTCPIYPKQLSLLFSRTKSWYWWLYPLVPRNYGLNARNISGNPTDKATHLFGDFEFGGMAIGHGVLWHSTLSGTNCIWRHPRRPIDNVADPNSPGKGFDRDAVALLIFFMIESISRMVMHLPWSRLDLRGWFYDDLQRW